MPEDTTRLSARIPVGLDRDLRIQAGRERVTRTQLVTRVLQTHCARADDAHVGNRELLDTIRMDYPGFQIEIIGREVVFTCVDEDFQTALDVEMLRAAAEADLRTGRVHNLPWALSGLPL